MIVLPHDPSFSHDAPPFQQGKLLTQIPHAKRLLLGLLPPVPPPLKLDPVPCAPPPGLERENRGGRGGRERREGREGRGR